MAVVVVAEVERAAATEKPGSSLAIRFLASDRGRVWLRVVVVAGPSCCLANRAG